MDAGTLELVEPDTALDFDETPQCEATGGCPRAAAWIARGECGHGDAYACDVHRATFIAWLAAVPNECIVCHRRNVPVGWIPVTR